MKAKAKVYNNNIPMNTFFQQVSTGAPKNTQNKSDPGAAVCGKSWGKAVLKQVDHFNEIMSQDYIHELFREQLCNYEKLIAYIDVHLYPALMPGKESPHRDI